LTIDAWGACRQRTGLKWAVAREGAGRCHGGRRL